METQTFEMSEQLQNGDKLVVVLTRRSRPSGSQKECPVCLGLHDNEIHSATVNVLEWFRSDVTRSFD